MKAYKGKDKVIAAVMEALNRLPLHPAPQPPPPQQKTVKKRKVRERVRLKTGKIGKMGVRLMSRMEI